MRFAQFWHIVQHWVVDLHRHFRTTHQSPIEDGTNRLSSNVGTELPHSTLHNIPDLITYLATSTRTLNIIRNITCTRNTLYTIAHHVYNNPKGVTHIENKMPSHATIELYLFSDLIWNLSLVTTSNNRYKNLKITYPACQSKMLKPGSSAVAMLELCHKYKCLVQGDWHT
jgi:hypothetical protein